MKMEEIIDLFEFTLLLSIFLCSLVAGFLFAFAVVVMPGIKNLGNKEFVQAFQVIDRIIQNNQPIFLLVWVGSAVALITSVTLGIGRLDGIERFLINSVAFTYLLGVQFTTVIINIPLNNKLQTLKVDDMSETAINLAREEFEPRWNRWNLFRTVLSCLSSALLIILLFLL